MTVTRRSALFAGVAAACGGPWVWTRSAAANSWQIGQSAPQTGPISVSSLETTAGARMYFNRLNARGGVHGRPIELVSLDDAQDPKRAVANTQQLLDQGVIALGLYRTTPAIEATLPMVRKAGIAFVGAQTGPSFIYESNSNLLFNTRASYHDEVARAVDYFSNLGMTRVGALVATDTFGQDVLVGLRRAMAANSKAELVSQAAFDNRGSDVAAQVEQIRKGNPQVVILIANLKASAAFIKHARANGFNPTFVSLSVTSTASFSTELGPYAEGIVVTQVVPTPYSRRLRLVAEFRDAVTQSGDAAAPVSHAALQGYVSAKLIHEGIRRCGPNADRGQLVQALNSTGRFDLGDYTLNYTPDSRQGTRLTELTFLSKSGKFMF